MFQKRKVLEFSEPPGLYLVIQLFRARKNEKYIPFKENCHFEFIFPNVDTNRIYGFFISDSLCSDQFCG